MNSDQGLLAIGKRWFPPLLAILAAVWAPPLAASGTIVITKLAAQAMPSPDGNGSFGGWFDYGAPCLNDSGQVAFSAHLIGSLAGGDDDETIIRAEPGGSLGVIAREGGPIPGGTGVYGALFAAGVRQYAMNNGGIVAFTTSLRGTPNGSADNFALFRSGGGLTAQLLARRGDMAPNTTSTFNGIDPPSINFVSPPAVAFYALLGTSSLPNAVYIHDGAALSLTSWLGQPVPGGNGSIKQFFDTLPPALRSNAAEVAFWAHLGGTVGGSLDDDAIFTSSSGNVTLIARGGQTAPGGNTYGEFLEPVLDLLGNTAFQSNFYPVPSGGEGVLIAGDGSDDLAGRSGRVLPDSTGQFHDFYSPSLSAGNVAAFKANLSGTPGGGFDDSGIYRGDGTILIQCAREDQVVPEGGGRFSLFGDVVGINAQAQVLFTATLRGTPGGSSDNKGLYLWDETQGLTKLLRTGDVIGGSAVEDFSTLTARDPGGFRCLNDASTAVAKVKFRFGGGVTPPDGIYLFRASTPLAVSGENRGAGPSLTGGPNPWAQGALSLRYALPSGPDRVTVTAHDVTGRLVRTLYAGPASKEGTLRWDGRDASGRPLASGVYFVRMQSAHGAAVTRIVRVGS